MRARLSWKRAVTFSWGKKPYPTAKRLLSVTVTCVIIAYLVHIRAVCSDTTPHVWSQKKIKEARQFLVTQIGQIICTIVIFICHMEKSHHSEFLYVSNKNNFKTIQSVRYLILDCEKQEHKIFQTLNILLAATLLRLLKCAKRRI